MRSENYNLKQKFSFIFLLILTLTLCVGFSNGRPGIAKADTIDLLKQKISEKADQIDALEAEIKEYEKKVLKTQSEAKNLTGTINTLTESQKKLEKDIKLTKAKIDKLTYEIEDLNDQIDNSEENIADDKKIIAVSLAKLNEAQSKGVLEILLGQNTISESFDEVDKMNVLQESLQERISEIEAEKNAIEKIKLSAESKKKDFGNMKKMLQNQNNSVLETKTQTSKILTDTKQKESNYQKILAEKKKAKEAFESEISLYEAAIKIAIDPKSLPKIGAGILKWPLDKVIITQYFGNTSFATQNPQIYNGSGHTGVDFAAVIGTPVKAALGGTVAGTGNTDIYPGCYSYGKWVFINHPNGLSTLYGHLSSVNVIAGQKISAGEIIGLSGNTGYSTGPHLHFGVYATAGVKIQKFDRSIYCKNATIPIADKTAYLNPLSYLQN